MISLRNLSSIFFKKPNNIIKEIHSNSLMIDWYSKNSTSCKFNTRSHFYEFINNELLENKPIDFLEFGVFKGKSIFEWTKLNKNEYSRFYGFDTFTGLPEDWNRIRHTDKKGHFDNDGLIPKTSDERINFIKGLFQETMDDFLKSFKPTKSNYNK